MIYRYKITGRGPTDRKRCRIYDATSRQEAVKRAEYDGTTVEEVEDLGAEPATARQIAYAKTNGLLIPDNPSKQEMIDLIGDHKAEQNDSRLSFDGRQVETTYTNRSGSSTRYSGAALVLTIAIALASCAMGVVLIWFAISAGQKGWSGCVPASSGLFGFLLLMFGLAILFDK